MIYALLLDTHSLKGQEFSLQKLDSEAQFSSGEDHGRQSIHSSQSKRPGQGHFGFKSPARSIKAIPEKGTKSAQVAYRQIQEVAQKEVDVAKRHLQNGDKRRALLALKKKKYQEKLLEQTDQQLFQLEQLVTFPGLIPRHLALKQH